MSARTEFGLSARMHYLLREAHSYIVAIGALDRPAAVLAVHALTSTRSPSAPAGPPLSAREQQILRLVSRGLPNKQIALRLGVALGTVRNQLHTLMRKLRARNRIEVLLRAAEVGHDVHIEVRTRIAPVTTTPRETCW